MMLPRLQWFIVIGGNGFSVEQQDIHLPCKPVSFPGSYRMVVNYDTGACGCIPHQGADYISCFCPQEVTQADGKFNQAQQFVLKDFIHWAIFQNENAVFARRKSCVSDDGWETHLSQTDKE